MSCPDLDTLLDPAAVEATASHVASCADCRRLVEMTAAIGGDFARGIHCDDAELLIAALAAGGLRAPDEKWLTEHLSGCRHCGAVARSVLLDPPASELPGSSPGSKALRVAILITAVAAVVVFAAVLITRVGAGDVPDGAGDAPAGAAPVEADPGEARAAIQTAVRNGDLGDVVDACENVRDAVWIKKCLVLACEAGDRQRARSYLQRLPEDDRVPLINVCESR